MHYSAYGAILCCHTPLRVLRYQCPECRVTYWTEEAAAECCYEEKQKLYVERVEDDKV
jgi:hypothetical protein